MKRRLFLNLIALTLFCLILSACASPTPTPTPIPTPKPKLIVAVDATFPPMEMVDEATGEVTGFGIALMNAIAEKGQFEVTFVNTNFDSLLTGMQNCTFDAAISSITITEDRKALMLFSTPYLNAGQIVTINSKEIAIKSVNDLKGRVIGMQGNTTSEIEARKIPNADVRIYDTYGEAFTDLKNGRIDAVIADYPSALAIVAESDGKLMTVGEVFTEESYGIAVCMSKPEYLVMINRGLSLVKQEGTLKQLEREWLTGR